MGGHLVDLIGVSQVIATFLVGILNFVLYGIAQALPPLGFLAGLADFLGTESVLHFLATVVAITLMILWAALFHVLNMIWVERKIYARIQDRRGPMLSHPLRRNWWKGVGFFQQFADGLKLLQKENITPAAADKAMFHLAPALLIASVLVAFVALPFSEGFAVANVPAGILLILAAFSLTPLAILLASWAQNNKYALLGGMRAAAMMISYEVPMILVTISVIVLAGTLNPIEIVHTQQSPSVLPFLGDLGLRNWFIIPGFLGFFIFLLAMVAEMERPPFDFPEAEEELVHGWLIEYGGGRFFMLYALRWLRTFLASALVVLLFLGGWDGPFLPQEVWFVLKVHAVFFIFVWISWSVPRMRIDQLLHIGWRKLIPLSLINLLIAVLIMMASSQGWV